MEGEEVELHPIERSSLDLPPRRTPGVPIGKILALGSIFVLLIIVMGILFSIRKTENSSSPEQTPTPITDFYADDHNRYCAPKAKVQPTYEEHRPIHLYNVTIWTGTGETIVGAIQLKDGKVFNIGTNLSPDSLPGASQVDGQGRFVTPGIVDMHSHAGADSYPALWGNGDVNDATNPLTPQFRVLDSFDPEDMGLQMILEGGVTTSQILPGSANVMGGEAFLIKHKLKGKTIESMRVPDAPRSLKMASGENPKRVYGQRRGVTPSARMGSAWLMRNILSQAQQLNKAQQIWCQQTQHSAGYPVDLSLDGLVALLRGEARLNVHAYQVHDFEMLIRLSKEFQFSIAAFHHSLEAWKVPHLFLDNNITIATFADLWGYKTEAYDGSVYGPAVLAKAGVQTALKSDHPVTFAGDLMWQAALSHHYGLSQYHALASLTLVPARSLGMDHRLGSLQIGKDADVVIWDRHPLQLGAKPWKVILEGTVVVDHPSPVIPPPSTVTSLLNAVGNTSCTATSDSYAITGVTLYTGDKNGDILQGITVVVREGNITCLAPDCSTQDITDLYEANGGYLISGIVEAGLARLGLQEIENDVDAMDGIPGGSPLYNIRALDGVHLGTRHVSAAVAGGVTLSITAGMGHVVLGGAVSAFGLQADFVREGAWQDIVGLAVTIGAGSKVAASPANSISGQFSMLRSYLDSNATDNSMLSLYRSGQIPMVAYMHQADDISTLLHIKKENDAKYSLNTSLVIVGGAEAHLLAQQLGEASVTVVLAPPRCVPANWEQRRCNRGSIGILHKAGVNVVLGTEDPGSSRNLRWEAGLALDQGITWKEAVDMITVNARKAFSLPMSIITVGTPCNVVLYSGDPLHFGSEVLLSAASKNVLCHPKQY
eukprot:TRINITY_DN6005_c0_g3_i1.p1 TRINITY_DN6005_c0_g3~~TRINITY_DN6005_c0_g3_i1.p1  ORF type:complete len:897 (+),score=188.82 TRINITY_DN6005_c0_g3_i1:43-2691(+)